MDCVWKLNSISGLEINLHVCRLLSKLNWSWWQEYSMILWQWKENASSMAIIWRPAIGETLVCQGKPGNLFSMYKMLDEYKSTPDLQQRLAVVRKFFAFHFHTKIILAVENGKQVDKKFWSWKNRLCGSWFWNILATLIWIFHSMQRNIIAEKNQLWAVTCKDKEW